MKTTRKTTNLKNKKIKSKEEREVDYDNEVNKKLNIKINQLCSQLNKLLLTSVTSEQCANLIVDQLKTANNKKIVQENREKHIHVQLVFDMNDL
jgi:hypothetical protein